MNVIRSLQTLRDGSAWLVAAAAAAALGGVASDAWMPRAYTAIATLLVDASGDEARGAAPWIARTPASSMATQLSLARSDRVARRAASALRVSDVAAPEDVSMPTMRDAQAARDLMNRVQIRAESPDSRVLQVLAQGSTPEQAARLANAVAAAYLKTAAELSAPPATVMPTASRSAAAPDAARGGGRSQLLNAALPPSGERTSLPWLRASLAAVSGALLALIVLLSREALRPRVRVPADLEALSLPHLVSLQRVHWPRREPHRLPASGRTVRGLP
ncbi:hypothetical protein [uncultured Methylibium sp.]|uniref:hypothetical protein n=1 Tax=uncultured Methylibium sp. TaxID=381093 RepID=UPI0025EF3C4E|nr:hypothetical protein [uncultured Methylibium sp.]